MGLFGKKKSDASDEAALAEIEASVRNIRSRMANHKMPIGDLFAMMNEDERPILSIIPKKAPPPPSERVSPDQITSNARKDEPKPSLDARSNDLFFRSL
ncbi:MAG: hypothetical protein AB7P33_08475 [Dehalococcoidia bacterium]